MHRSQSSKIIKNIPHAFQSELSNEIKKSNQVYV